MKTKVKNFIKYTLVFAIYYSIPYLFNLIFEIFNIDLSKFSSLSIVLILILMDIVPILFLVSIYIKELKSEFEINKKTFKDNIEKYLKLWLFGLILMGIANTIVTFFTNNDISNNEEVVRNIAKILPIYSLFTTCICAPIGEELAYRKTIGKIFNNKNISIIMSGFVFGLAHVLGTYESISDLLYVIPYGVFGSVFMYMYLNSKTIWSTITIHFMHNAILMISYLIRL